MSTHLIQKISSLQDFTKNLLSQLGLGGNLLDLLSVVINIVALLFTCWFFYMILRTIIRYVVRPWLKKTKDEQGLIFIKKRVFDALAKLAAGYLLYQLLPTFFNISKEITHGLRILIIIYIIVMLMVFLTRIFHSLEYLGRRSERFEKKPISSYIQVALIISYLICGILIVSILVGKNPMTIITAFGAGMAIVLLVFKDLILGLVASVQVSVNDMVRVGDWISVHNHNADGPVTEINLTSVKVRNWDNSITNVPTYALVSSGFKNVREMQDLGIRRFLHHLLIDLKSIKEIDEDFIENLRSKGLFSGEKSHLKWNDEKEYEFDQVNTVSNLGLFRRYIESFLIKHPGVDNGYMVVRQLQQNGNGLPLEIYAWVKSVSFKPLNLVQSDIFEHLYTVIEDFDLVLFQKPMGKDIQELNNYKFDEKNEK